MDRFERDPRSGTQQTRDDIGVPGSGMGDPASGQGQFGQQQGKAFYSYRSIFHCTMLPFCYGQANLFPQITPTRLVVLTVSNPAIRPVMPSPTPKGWIAASSAPTTCGRVEPARAPLGTPPTRQISTEAHRGQHPVAMRILQPPEGPCKVTPMTILRAMVAEESRPSPVR